MHSLQNPYTLIIRFWHEPGGAEEVVLRGSIEHVQSGARVFFQSYEDLKTKLFQLLEWTPGTSHSPSKGERTP